MKTRNKVNEETYIAQISAMVKTAQRWRADNPTKTALVAFNYPREVMLVAAISVAIEKGFVSTNAAGLELIKALGSWDDENEPSVLMVRIAWDYTSGTV